MLYLKGPIWALNFQIFHKVGINILLTTAWTFFFFFFIAIAYHINLPLRHCDLSFWAV